MKTTFTNIIKTLQQNCNVWKTSCKDWGKDGWKGGQDELDLQYRTKHGKHDICEHL